MKKQATKIETTADEALQAELAACETTSAKIRLLTAKQMQRGAIAKLLGIRYQHVRNVQITPIKKQA